MARDYTDIDKRELLIDVGKFDGAVHKAARANGVPDRTLRRWWDALSEDERQDFIVEGKKRAEGWWQEVHDAALQVARQKINEMSGRDAIVAAGISFDKLRLIRGEATDINSTVSSDAESLAKDINAILSGVKAEKPE